MACPLASLGRPAASGKRLLLLCVSMAARAPPCIGEGGSLVPLPLLLPFLLRLALALPLSVISTALPSRSRTPPDSSICMRSSTSIDPPPTMCETTERRAHSLFWLHRWQESRHTRLASLKNRCLIIQ